MLQVVEPGKTVEELLEEDTTSEQALYTIPDLD